MPFEPFGYSFELKSHSPPPDVKAAIRSRMKEWFDPKSGARGWIVGPFICLWFSALDSHGPMLFGRISSADPGTRITGRAGSDLNGLVLYSVLLFIMAIFFYQMLSADDLTADELVIFGGLILISPLVFWWSHQDRREAEPLVRFLRDAITPSGRKLRGKSATATISKALSLDVGGEVREGPVTPDAIHDALLGTGAGDFVILASAPETYIQTMYRDGGFSIERRDGSAQRHFRAVRRAVPPACGPDAVFSFEEARETFIAYASEAPMPSFAMWEPMQLAS